MSDEVTIEPVPGLPHALPEGELLLWQGRPDWRALNRSAFHIRWLTAWFSVFTVLRGLAALQDGKGVAGALLASLIVVPLAAVALLLVTLIAWLNARATVYSITSRRLVLRFGIAFPMTFNLPFRRIAAADLRVRAGGEGDIALRLSGPARIAYLHLWPHARPFQLARAQPMLRAIPGVAAVAKLLSEAALGSKSIPATSPPRAAGDARAAPGLEGGRTVAASA